MYHAKHQHLLDILYVHQILKICPSMLIFLKWKLYNRPTLIGQVLVSWEDNHLWVLAGEVKWLGGWKVKGLGGW